MTHPGRATQRQTSRADAAHALFAPDARRTRTSPAIVQNLSLKGIGVHVDRAYTVGANLHVLLVNASHTFSVARELKVVRCFRAATNQYFVAGPFASALRHEEVVPFIL